MARGPAAFGLTSLLTLEHVRHAYGDRPVLDDVSLDVPAGSVMGLIGPSGCGKTTTLHLAAALLAPSAGGIVNSFARTALVFQEPRLLPWQSALDNAAFGLRAAGIAPSRRRQVAAALLVRLGLGADVHPLPPRRLSGGMRQRVAIARALAVAPELLLLDEPFAALDVGLRRDLQVLLRELIDERGLTALVVTHDLVDAVRLCDRIAVLSPAPARVVATVAVERPPGERDEAYLYETAASLLRRPEVAAAFAAGSVSRPSRSS